MVQAKPKKRKPEAVDFKRIKRKVGRRAPQKTSATDTSFKTRTVNVREQSLVANKGGVLVSSKNLSVLELLSKARHHNARVRKEALDGLLEIVEANQSNTQLRTQLPAIMTCVVELVNDDEKAVRVAVQHLLLALFATSTFGRVHWCQPFLRLLFFHVRAGLNSLRLGCRMDAMRLVLLISKNFPERVLAQRADLIDLFGALLKSTLSRVSTSTNVTNAASQSHDGQANGNNNNSATSVSITVSAPGHGPGVLRDFKDAKARAKAQAQQRAKRTKALAAAAAAVAAASSDADLGEDSSEKDGGKKSGATSMEGQGLELWAEVARGLLQLLQLGHSSLHTSHSSHAGISDPLESEGCASVMRHIGLEYQESASLEESIRQHQEIDAQESSSSSVGAPKTNVKGEELAKILSSLWNQVCTLHTVSCGRGRSAVSDARAVISDLLVAAETLSLCFANILSMSESYAESTVVRHLVHAIEDSFPVKNTGHPELASSIFKVNTMLAQTLLLSQLKSVESESEYATSVATWVLQSAETKKALEASRLEALVQVIHKGLLQVPVKSHAAGQLREARKVLFGRALQDGIGQSAIIHVLDAIKELADEDPEMVEPEWAAALPRIAWEMGVNSDESESMRMRFMLVCFSTIKILAVRQAEHIAWDRFARWLSPFLQARRGGLVTEPLANSMSMQVQLQVVDLVAMLPVSILPESLIRAMAGCAVSLDAKLVDSSQEKHPPAGTALTLARLLRAPFAQRSAMQQLSGPATNEAMLDEAAEVTHSLAFFITLVCVSAKSPVALQCLSSIVAALRCSSDSVDVAITKLVPDLLADNLSELCEPVQVQNVAHIIAECLGGVEMNNAIIDRLANDTLHLLGAQHGAPDATDFEAVFRLLTPSDPRMVNMVLEANSKGEQFFAIAACGWIRELEYEFVHLDSLRSSKLVQEPGFKKVLQLLQEMPGAHAKLLLFELESLTKKASAL
mmetsp:Transcript_4676/g.9838  ORF Transcript_4676/g.9838 Transcript_4676/m.9838 type:complete len:970 (+) Transcript_4676:130-3039(+)|eukprot:CAMPEP_0171519928 /NCGR_PEP_ID=MMETSP0959-20130129/6194_1 /TAXON_ID=87120 /ORGANISM="Aurantiochytrium limacinum, Strain ATCCMYA-1381" /LENGTH=969 /DNA_ID=CAMNT_0012059463 /DNA_START=94 /DNA_END=3003 /DNA_ORIENTATION=-